MILDDAFDNADTSQAFLTLLNGQYVRFIPGFVEQEVVPGPQSGFRLRPKDASLDQAVREVYVNRLRALVDAWIETGRTDAADEPSQRKLTRELKLTLWKWGERNPPELGFEDSGETVVYLPAPRINYGSPLATALNNAIQFFARFLDSPYRFRLFKCQRCAVYYFSKREPRSVIKFGTYCPAHRHQATAKRSNARRRDPERETKLQLAVETWLRAPEGLSDTKKLEQVVREVNAALRKSKRLHRCGPIQRNFVTRHRAEIESRAERRSHAQSKRT